MDAKGNFCLAFDSLRLKIQWRSLFDKVLEISLLQIDGLTLNLIEDATGRINLVNALTAGDDMPEDSPENDTSRTGLPLNVKIQTAQITRGALSFSDPENTVDVGSLNVSVTEVDLQQMSGAVSIDVGVSHSPMRQQ